MPCFLLLYPMTHQAIRHINVRHQLLRQHSCLLSILLNQLVNLLPVLSLPHLLVFLELVSQTTSSQTPKTSGKAGFSGNRVGQYQNHSLGGNGGGFPPNTGFRI